MLSDPPAAATPQRCLTTGVCHCHCHCCCCSITMCVCHALFCFGTQTCMWTQTGCCFHCSLCVHSCTCILLCCLVSFFLSCCGGANHHTGNTLVFFLAPPPSHAQHSSLMCVCVCAHHKHIHNELCCLLPTTSPLAIAGSWCAPLCFPLCAPPRSLLPFCSSWQPVSTDAFTLLCNVHANIPFHLCSVCSAFFVNDRVLCCVDVLCNTTRHALLCHHVFCHSQSSHCMRARVCDLITMVCVSPQINQCFGPVHHTTTTHNNTQMVQHCMGVPICVVCTTS